MCDDAEPADPNAALDPAEVSAIVQYEINQAIAELRELYRLVRMFPFYRYKDRHTLADMLTSQLKTWCESQELPDAGVHGRMRQPDFERFLGRSPKRAARLRSMTRSTCVTSTGCTTTGCASP